MIERICVMLWRIAVLILLLGANSAVAPRHQSVAYVFVCAVFAALLACLYPQDNK